MRRALWPAVLFALLSGCAGAPVRFSAPREPVELKDTPFFAQTEHHCGPAALATVLNADGVRTTPDELSPLIFVPGREGSLQVEMLAASRRFDRLPLRVQPTAEALFAALDARDPVLVLQNLGLQRWPYWHYAVLIGYEPDGQRFLLRSGTTERESLSATRFLSSWQRADHWAIVLSAPDSVPAFATLDSWLAAAAPFESLGRFDVADQAYRAATVRWPDSALAWQALANARYGLKDAAGAELALNRAVAIAPQSAVARNNLANLLLERGCPVSAGAQLDALGQAPDAFASALRITRAAIAASPVAQGDGCPP